MIRIGLLILLLGLAIWGCGKLLESPETTSPERISQGKSSMTRIKNTNILVLKQADKTNLLVPSDGENGVKYTMALANHPILMINCHDNHAAMTYLSLNNGNLISQEEADEKKPIKVRWHDQNEWKELKAYRLTREGKGIRETIVVNANPWLRRLMGKEGAVELQVISDETTTFNLHTNGLEQAFNDVLGRCKKKVDQK